MADQIRKPMLFAYVVTRETRLNKAPFATQKDPFPDLDTIRLDADLLHKKVIVTIVKLTSLS